jgi:hypothetical protein
LWPPERRPGREFARILRFSGECPRAVNAVVVSAYFDFAALSLGAVDHGAIHGRLKYQRGKSNQDSQDYKQHR